VESPRINGIDTLGAFDRGRMWRLTGLVWAQPWFKLVDPAAIDQDIVSYRAGNRCPVRRLCPL
jgi:hypothetical protein